MSKKTWCLQLEAEGTGETGRRSCIASLSIGIPIRSGPRDRRSKMYVASKAENVVGQHLATGPHQSKHFSSHVSECFLLFKTKHLYHYES